MLYSSGLNLLSGVTDFIDYSTNITIFSAYLKKDQFVKLNLAKKINQLVVRWDIADLCLEVSDLDVYNYCKDNNITLLRNTRLHLKAFWDLKGDRVFFGSANVTGRGLGEEGNYNYELNGLFEGITFKDVLYFNQIIQSSEIVDDCLYGRLKRIVVAEKKDISFTQLPTEKKETDFFLISQLPMTETPEVLFERYKDQSDLTKVQRNCAAHDIVIYNIKPGLGKSEFIEHLKNRFNEHPFIVAFKQAVQDEERQSMRFGAVRCWFAQNTTTVPIPRAWDLNDYLKTLYAWICYFDVNFTWSVPGAKSEVIFYRPQDIQTPIA